MWDQPGDNGGGEGRGAWSAHNTSIRDSCNGLRAATVREDQKLVYMGVDRLPGGACAMPGHGVIGFSLL